MKFKILFIFALIFSSLPLYAMTRELDQDLISATVDKDIKEIKSLLFDAPKEYTPDTPLLTALMYGRTKIVKLFLEHNANANARNYYGGTPLMSAVKKAHIKIIKLLLEHDADVNAINENETALKLASWNDDSLIVNILLRHEAQIKVSDDEKESALQLATRFDRFFTVELFLKHIIRILDQTDDAETCHMWDQYIFNVLKKEINIEYHFGSSIKIINAFRIILHHADKLPLSRKKVESLTIKALGQTKSNTHSPTGEYAFRKSIKHLRRHAF